MKILCFGIIKDIVGSSHFEIESDKVSTVAELKALMYDKFEDIKSYKSFMVAVNQSYADDKQTLSPSDEIALIPPVSGG